MAGFMYFIASLLFTIVVESTNSTGWTAYSANYSTCSSMICGVNAECFDSNGSRPGVCKCLSGYTYNGASEIYEEDNCTATCSILTCGLNAECDDNGGTTRGVCKFKDRYTYNEQSEIPQDANCTETAAVLYANLQFKIIYDHPSIHHLQDEFERLVKLYNNILCPFSRECGISDLQINSTVDFEGNNLSEVLITIDTPVHNITNQTSYIKLIQETLITVNNDNAFMTLIDSDNRNLVKPMAQKNSKSEVSLCCHQCPPGHAYKLGYCVRCPAEASNCH